MIKVLVVDDSAVILEFISYMLGCDPEIQVIGTAANGEEAVQFLESQRPDVIVMDIHMPRMDGIEATRRIMASTPVPIVIVSASWSPDDVEKSFSAIDAGALTILAKPPGPGDQDHEKLTDEFIATVKAMSEVKVVRRWPKGFLPGRTEKKGDWQKTAPGLNVELVAIGSSTGGPLALKTILAQLPGDFGAAILVVQHISPGFLPGMVEWLQGHSRLPIHIPSTGERLHPGHIYVAPDDFHLGVENGGRIVLSKDKEEHSMRPAVSYLFRSVAESYGGRAVGVLLTGMGMDGSKELKLIREQRGITIAQDEETSVVHGMPGEAIRNGSAQYILALEEIPLKLQQIVGR